MDKMRMESPDITNENIEKIAALFPNCITEAKNKSSGGGAAKSYKF